MTCCLRGGLGTGLEMCRHEVVNICNGSGPVLTTVGWLAIFGCLAFDIFYLFLVIVESIVSDLLNCERGILWKSLLNNCMLTIKTSPHQKLFTILIPSSRFDSNLTILKNMNSIQNKINLCIDKVIFAEACLRC